MRIGDEEGRREMGSGRPIKDIGQSDCPPCCTYISGRSIKFPPHLEFLGEKEAGASQSNAHADKNYRANQTAGFLCHKSALPTQATLKRTPQSRSAWFALVKVMCKERR